IASEVPLGAVLIFFVLAPPSILTVGTVPLVSKVNPAGALRMIVPVVTAPTFGSRYAGPVSEVKAPVATVSAEIALPPVALVSWLALTVWVKLAALLLLKLPSPLYTAPIV